MLTSVRIVYFLLLLFANLFAVNIRGIVLNSELGKPVEGANIVLSDSEQGTASDHYGKFNLISDRDFPVVLRITHVGFEQKEITLQSDHSVIIKLTPRIIPGKAIEVMGIRPKFESDVSNNVELLDIKEVETLGARELGSALRRISSINIKAAPSGKQTISIRGSNPNDVAVYLDGIKINNALTGIADLSFIDLNGLKQVQVIKGGNTALYGHGALGGVVNLVSKEADENSFEYVQGNGQTFDDDFDLSINASLVAGPVGVGGRFSGVSRAFGGRSVSLHQFQNLFSNITLSSGQVNARWYRLDKSLEFPPGGIAQGDSLTMVSMRYRGNILRNMGWEFFWGKRQWAFYQDFYNNVHEKLENGNVNIHILKNISYKTLMSTVQVEYETQLFNGHEDFYNEDSKLAGLHDADMKRSISTLAVTGQWSGYSSHQNIDYIKWEAGVRFDLIETARKEKFTVIEGDYDDLFYGSPDKDFRNNNMIFSNRVGVEVTGRTPDFHYSLFVNQGNNNRVPTLVDHFYHSRASMLHLVDSLLHVEKLSTSEINLSLTFEDIDRVPFVTQISTSFNLFNNYYDNKIAYYQVVSNYPSVPINSSNSDIKGIEYSARLDLFNGKLNFTGSGTNLNVSNPLVFPNKPGYRYIFSTELDMGIYRFSYDQYSEGEQVIFIPEIGNFLQKPRSDSNLNISIEYQFWKVSLTASYTIRNIKSKAKTNISLEDALREGFNYFEKYREIATIRLKLTL